MKRWFVWGILLSILLIFGFQKVHSVHADDDEDTPQYVRMTNHEYVYDPKNLLTQAQIDALNAINSPDLSEGKKPLALYFVILDKIPSQYKIDLKNPDDGDLSDFLQDYTVADQLINQDDYPSSQEGQHSMVLILIRDTGTVMYNSNNDSISGQLTDFSEWKLEVGVQWKLKKTFNMQVSAFTTISKRTKKMLIKRYVNKEMPSKQTTWDAIKDRASLLIMLTFLIWAVGSFIMWVNSNGGGGSGGSGDDGIWEWMYYDSAVNKHDNNDSF